MIWKIRNKDFHENDFPLIMGIINLTEDSFYSNSRVIEDTSLLKRVETMLNNGVDIIDIGAESTRPGALKIDEKAEQNKIVNALNLILAKFPKSIISVDTYRSKTAKAAVEFGAQIINDISMGTMDLMMFETISQLECGYVLTHIQGTPADMQVSPHYHDAVKEISSLLLEKTQQLRKLGMKQENIVIDPGIGFGKKLEHNLRIMKNISIFSDLGYPVLIGLSRKSFIGDILDNSPEERLIGTTVFHTISLLNGASILRVHDGKEANEIRKCIREYMKI